jgi:tRNA pseudouridine32 synthase / 23S rRNA pseudouridine746 synthase
LTAALVVLFASEHVVVVDKPAGIATEPDRDRQTSLRDLVAAWVEGRDGGSARMPHAVSRLDTNVSGAVTFALTELGMRKAAAAKEHGHIARRYVAITAAIGDAGGSWSAPVQNKPALTRWQRIATTDGRASLLLLVPETGRTHQLRIHASSGGAAIFGDGRYGGKSTVADSSGRVRRVDRVLLHAAAVHVPFGLPNDPPGFVVAPIPEIMRDVWQSLDGAAEAWNDVSRACVGSF